MKPLNKNNILPYLEQFVFPHLNFITVGKLQDFKKVSGGLVSQVLRLVVDGTPFYLKQVIESVQYEKFFSNPNVFEKQALKEWKKWIFNENRQSPEARALRIFERAGGYGTVPHIYYHDVPNKVLILSEVCPGGRLFEDVISKKIDIEASKNLAKIAAQLVNNTYGKIKPLRSAVEDKKVKFIKLKYQCLEVYKNLNPQTQKLVKEAQTKFVRESMRIDKVLVHGDYHPRNILVKGPQVGTLDLEEAHLGDPAFDIGILLGSYLIRADYHKNIRSLAIGAVLEMIKIFLDNIDIPESKDKIENRIKHHIGGLMLSRIDGFTSKWTTWIKKESAKKSIRLHATQIILDNQNSLHGLIQKIYK